MMKERLLFIDTETGGLDPQKHSLLSVGLVLWDNGIIIDSKEILINDGVLSATDEALAINRINLDEHKKIAISPKDAIEQIKQFAQKCKIGDDKITIAGHNVQFDVGFLKQLFYNNEERFHTIFSHRIIDTSSILNYLYLAGKLKQKAVSSDSAFEYFGIEVDGRHTALGDAVATAELFTKLLEC